MVREERASCPPSSSYRLPFTNKIRRTCTLLHCMICRNEACGAIWTSYKYGDPYTHRLPTLMLRVRALALSRSQAIASS